MPYEIVNENGKHCVKKKDGETLHCYDDEKEAQDYMKALYANVHNSEIVDFSMSIIKASYDKSDNNPRRWRAVDSDTGSDLYNEQMSNELYQDFIQRIQNDTPVPEPFKSVVCEDAWCGGMPYLSIAHYKAGESAKNVPGKVEAIYIDGNKLKSKGTLDDSPMGRTVFDSLCDDLYRKKSGDTEHLPIRISIGFLDLQHKHTAEHGGQEFIFTRSAIGQICPLCEQGIGGKIYLKGQLVHLALTRVPVNTRTEMIAERSMDIVTKKDDAKSIIKELADELDERSLAEGTLVVRSDKTEATSIDSMPVPDGDILASCYDPNTDSYNQDCLNKTLVANMVEMRKQMQTVKSIVDVASINEKSTSEATMSEKVEKMVLGGESVPEKKFEYMGISGDPNANVTANPLPQKAKDEEAGEADDSGDEEKKEMAKKSALDTAYEQMKYRLDAGATIEEVQQSFNELASEIEKSYVPKSQPIDATNLAEIVRSAVESAVAPLKMEIAQLKAVNTVSKSQVGQVPVSRALTLKQSDLLMRSQVPSSQPVVKLSQIQKLARKGTFGGAGIPDPLEQQ